MAKKELYKIVLQPDGSWKNVYRAVPDLESIPEMMDLQELLIELALEKSDYEESKVVLQHIMTK